MSKILRDFPAAVAASLLLVSVLHCGTDTPFEDSTPKPLAEGAEAGGEFVDGGSEDGGPGDAASTDGRPPEPTPSGTRPVRILQYNLTGHARPGTAPTSAPPNGGSLDALLYLESQMKQFPAVGSAVPDAVLLEEVCYSQFADLEARYTPDPTKKYVVFNPFMNRHPLCAGTDKRLGQVLLSPWPIANAVRTELGDTDESYGTPDAFIVFGLLCGDVQVPGLPVPLRVCVTHLRGASGVPVDTYKG